MSARPVRPALSALAILLAGCTSVQIHPHTPRDVASFPDRPAEPTVPRPPLTRMPAHVPLPQVSTPRIPPPAMPGNAPVAPGAPVPVITCDPGGCWSDGRRYEGGTGGTFLDKNGRPCQSNGNWIQCF
ncbi:MULTISPECIES: hypothetical protein [Oxalobacteraceae]|jgi:hypothetical protein|uniref:hypothetical protein n=1 Tax=Oxalobacteraceae TaxID=75682 RepID=UPI0010A52804|nr:MULTISPECIES: hypothetical protein [Oxalobacteraceae]